MNRARGVQAAAWGAIAWHAVGLGGAGGCALAPPAPHTTFLQSVDVTQMTDQMAESFLRDEEIASRFEADAPWVISFDRIVNHTNQIMPQREKWLYVARLRSHLAQSDVGSRRSIIWIMPPEQWTAAAEELDEAAEPYGLRLPPTHLLTGEFSALTVTSGRGRSDTYVCAYELLDLQTGRIVWRDHWEVKRAVSGVTYD